MQFDDMKANSRQPDSGTLYDPGARPSGWGLARFLNFLMGVLAGLAIVRFLWPRFDSPPEELLLWFGGFLIFLMGVLYLQVLFHEAGHLVFGLFTGYRFVSWRVGRLMVIRRDGRLRLVRYQLAGTAGQCLLAPPEGPAGEMPLTLYHLGGSLVNLMIGLLGLGAAIGFPAGSLAASVSEIFALTGFAYGAVNAVPMRLAGIDNDGANLRTLLRRPVTRRDIWLQLKVNEAMVQGHRLRDLPEDWFDLPEIAAMDNALTAGTALMYFGRRLDEHRIAESRDLARYVLTGARGMADIQRLLLGQDLYFLELLMDPAVAGEGPPIAPAMKGLYKALGNHPSVLRTQYAKALLADQDEAAAAELRRQFERVREKGPYQGDLQSEAELMDLAHDRARDLVVNGSLPEPIPAVPVK